MPLNSPCQEVGFICPFVVIDHTYLGATTVVAPGLMLDHFLPIPDAESLPFYPSVLKLVVWETVTQRLPAISAPARVAFPSPFRVVSESYGVGPGRIAAADETTSGL